MGFFSVRALELLDHREAHGVEALHVGRAAPVETRALAPQRERIAGPRLSRHRHDVGVAGEHDSAVDHRADGGEDRGLVARRVRHDDVRHVVRAQQRLDEGDEIEIALRAFRVERDQAFENVDGCEKAGIGVLRHGARLLQLMTRRACGESSENAGIATSNASPSRPRTGRSRP